MTALVLVGGGAFVFGVGIGNWVWRWYEHRQDCREMPAEVERWLASR